jgi:hypothetical protein
VYRLEAMINLHPSVYKHFAKASPRPELAPVMRTTLPSRLESCFENLCFREKNASINLPNTVKGKKSKQAIQFDHVLAQFSKKLPLNGSFKICTSGPVLLGDSSEPENERKHIYYTVIVS